MRLALLSDIHGNLEALEAVLVDLAPRNVETIYCLGDTIGYGPNPVECLALAMERFSLHLMGNHEYAVLTDPEGFNPVAQKAIFWTREQIQDPAMWAFLKNLKPAKLVGRSLFAHASVRDPLLDYVREVEDRETLREIVDTIEKEFRDFDVCFVGHNHKAFLGTVDGVLYPHDVVSRFQIRDQKLYVCVGSVGQPRDRDPRSSYVIFDGDAVEYHRVPYDNAKTAAKILAAGLPEFLADRLLKGH